MTVEQLIEFLSDCDPSAIVTLSNATGTKTSILADVEIGYHYDDDTYVDFVTYDDAIEDPDINLDKFKTAVRLYSED